jgi:2-phosphosulfolactate phosphatase
MTIKILHLIEGARQARGLAVVIDVFRAFSAACYVMSNHAERIIPVDDLKVAYELKEKNPAFVLMGERDNRKPQGFDYGNSPAEVKDLNLMGKTIVHTTSAGTQGIYNACHADEVITGSFVNIHAIIDFIKARKTNLLSLVCMGYKAKYPTEEDTLCAEYIKNTLLGEPVDYNKMVDVMKNGPGKRFFDPANKDFSPPEDFNLCTRLGIFDFVLKAKSGKLIELEREDVNLSLNMPG